MRHFDNALPFPGGLSRQLLREHASLWQQTEAFHISAAGSGWRTALHQNGLGTVSRKNGLGTASRQETVPHWNGHILLERDELSVMIS